MQCIININNYSIYSKYKNKNIAIVGENSYNWLVAFFGIVLSNNLAVIIDKDLAEEELGWVAEKGLEEMCKDSYQYAIKNK